MSYAEVAVNAPAGRPTYTYHVPGGLEVRAGQLVWVPFGVRTVRGVVVTVDDGSSRQDTRPILSVSPEYALSPRQLEAGTYISSRYLSSLYSAVSLFLPPGIERDPLVFYEAAEQPNGSAPVLKGLEAELYHAALEHRKLEARTLRRDGRASAVRRALDALVAQGILVRREIPRERRVGVRKEVTVTLCAGTDDIAVTQEMLHRKRADRQARVVEYLRAHGGVASARELRAATAATSSVLRAMSVQGLIEMSERRVWRATIAAQSSRETAALTLTSAQSRALDSIRCSLESWSFSENLLYGVTGSGKTELYLRAAELALAQGRQVVCLVPEIALAAQTVERFTSRFPGRVALLHSGLTLGQQRDEWEQVQRGDRDVVVGPRSALFAPLEKPGLIILDEEHEWAYKQEDIVPRYHARDVARHIAQLSGAVLMLGSATPDVETFHRAATGVTRLLELPSRIGGSAGLPPIEVVDMRDELRYGNTSLFSRALVSAMSEALSRREQVLLFLNRRGTATLVQCRRCSYVFACPRCSVALAYHATRNGLLCHRCGYATRVPERCPRCSSGRLRYLGVGTQRVVEEVRLLHPDAQVIRWDSDVPAKTRGGTALQDAIREGRADVVVGTQMVAKGHDFPGVTLVGVVGADVGLSVPDYRSSERSFQLLCQAAGRAGRGINPGRVVVQTYEPENYVLRCAATHDYPAFYQEEIRYRREAYYPPFCSMVRLLFSHVNEERCRRESERVAHELSRRVVASDLRITGPSPAFIRRLRGHYRWQVTLRGPQPTEVLADLELPRGWVVDVDPVSVA